MQFTSSFLALIAAVAVSATPLTASDNGIAAPQDDFCAIGGILSGRSIPCAVAFVSSCLNATYQPGSGTGPGCCKDITCTTTAFTGDQCYFTYGASAVKLGLGCYSDLVRYSLNSRQIPGGIGFISLSIPLYPLLCINEKSYHQAKLQLYYNGEHHHSGHNTLVP
ncbi:hypothetical protein C8F04DRAFT_1174861 [Mycena alexandri]|uniref:Hydrophobin n=1 Tax=Mycena alexandri TaxID=1745969 RepID=A0AAD6TDE9_9AGAR|nr:hypothetical protein C8F04DRAFT_1174861 [Mycena alexandri]